MDPILDPSGYDLRAYVDELGMAITVPPEREEMYPGLRQAIDENRLYNTGKITYQNRKYDIDVPVIEAPSASQDLPPTYVTSDNSKFALTGYKKVFQKDTDTTFVDWGWRHCG